MLTYREYIEESIATDLIKDLIPDPILHWLKRKLHTAAYTDALKIYHKLITDKNRNLSQERALIIAAETVGISTRELKKVWNQIQDSSEYA